MKTTEQGTPTVPTGGEVSRRLFLTSAGLTAGGAMLGSGLSEALASPAAEPAVIGPDALSVTLQVNGLSLSAVVPPNATLAEVLRGPLNLTGTKIGWDRGSCSACTVWLDGEPVASCTILTIDVGNRVVTTIEGLADGGKPHPVQASFVEHDALQCGFCTPGMVMSSAALLAHNPASSLDDVKIAVSGHLCRCGTYPHVFAATLAAAKSDKG